MANAQPEQDKLINRYSNEYNIPAGLIDAIIEVESRNNTYAIRYQPNYRWTYRAEQVADLHGLDVDTEISMQKTSWGLMQIMGATARQLGFSERYLSKLLKPKLNIKYGCKFLHTQHEKYGSWKDAVSAYNQGNPRKDKNGKYYNYDYVEAVYKIYKE